MKTGLLVAGFAVLTFGCNDKSASTVQPPAGVERSPATDAQSEAGRSGSQHVTLVGCLTENLTDGTPVESARSHSERGLDPTRAARLFRLVDAGPEDVAPAGVGASGAGGSGGPLVAKKASYDLDQLPEHARAAINSRVRVSGTLDTSQAVTPTQSPVQPEATDGPTSREMRRIAIDGIEMLNRPC